MTLLQFFAHGNSFCSSFRITPSHYETPPHFQQRGPFNRFPTDAIPKQNVDRIFSFG
jgi:hypothetical protein